MIKSEFESLAGIQISDDTYERLRAYADLVQKWNPRINLVSKSQLPALWARHIADSAQIQLVAPSEARLWADFGSGGGFPGIVLAILAQEFAPERRFVLVESDLRKSAFLMEAARHTGAAVTVKAERAEALQPLGAKVVSARALASLDMLFGFCAPHMAEGAIGIFPKGASYQSEIDAARAKWDFLLQVAPSRTEDAAKILIISELRAKA